MGMKPVSMHRTLTTRLVEEDRTGWEFYCSACGYHTRYWESSEGQESKLFVVNSGDPEARHTNSLAAAGLTEALQPQHESANSPEIRDHPAQELDEESWLTPELRLQLETILNKYF